MKAWNEERLQQGGESAVGGADQGCSERAQGLLALLPAMKEPVKDCEAARARWNCCERLKWMVAEVAFRSIGKGSKEDILIKGSQQG